VFLKMYLAKFLVYSVDLSMGIINDRTCIKMIFSFSPGIKMYFIGNTLYNSDDSVTVTSTVLLLILYCTLYK
jgi:hypothetical protein